MGKHEDVKYSTIKKLQKIIVEIFHERMTALADGTGERQTVHRVPGATRERNSRWKKHLMPLACWSKHFRGYILAELAGAVLFGMFLCPGACRLKDLYTYLGLVSTTQPDE